MQAIEGLWRRVGRLGTGVALLAALAACGGGEGAAPLAAVGRTEAPGGVAALRAEPYRPTQPADAARMTLQQIPAAAPRLRAESIELAPLTAREARAAAAERVGVQRIGIGRPVAAAAQAEQLSQQLRWQATDDGGWLGAIALHSPGAIALRLGLGVEQLPPGTRLRVLGGASAPAIQIDAADVLRTVQANVDADGDSAAARTYWLPSVEGERVQLEFDLPPGTAPDRLRVALPLVAHQTTTGAALATEQKAAAGLCNVSASCRAESNPTDDAVARLRFVESDGSVHVCTGTLLNDKNSSGTPYMLTAHHCISQQTVASTLETDWFYRAAGCGSSELDARHVARTGGADLLVTLTPTDTTFLRLRAAPPAGVLFAGWDASGSVLTGSILTLHHASGDPLKVSRGQITGQGQCFVGCFAATDGDMLRVSWSEGVTEPGSSGSALLRTSGGSNYVIGQLYGGVSSCSASAQPDFFGRLDRAYPSLQRWLSPTATTTPTPNGRGPVYRFYNASTGGHFYTNNLVERDYVIANNKAFAYEGVGFYAYGATAFGQQPVFRFYNRATSRHFYTISTAERDEVIRTQPTYQYEGPVWYAQAGEGTGASPMFRFYHPQFNAHFYTISAAERDQVIATIPQYKYEGIGYYAWVTP